MKSNKVIHMGLIGLGQISDVQMKALKKVDNLELSAVCDIDTEKFYKAPGRIPYYSIPHQFFNHTPMDAVLISVPPDRHLSTAIQALEAGHHILLEKPLVTSEKELIELTKKETESDYKVHSALHAAFGVEVEWFSKRFPNELPEDSGKLLNFHSSLNDAYVLNNSLPAHAISLGGSWIDSAINSLSILDRVLHFDEVNIEESSRVSLPQFKCREIQGSALLSYLSAYTDKSFGTIETNWTEGVKQKTTTFFFENGTWILDHSGQAVSFRDSEGNKKRYADYSGKEERLIRHYVGVLDHFSENIISGRSNFENSRRLHEVMLSFYS